MHDQGVSHCLSYLIENILCFFFLGAVNTVYLFKVCAYVYVLGTNKVYSIIHILYSIPLYSIVNILNTPGHMIYPPPAGHWKAGRQGVPWMLARPVALGSGQ